MSPFLIFLPFPLYCVGIELLIYQSLMILITMPSVLLQRFSKFIITSYYTFELIFLRSTSIMLDQRVLVITIEEFREVMVLRDA